MGSLTKPYTFTSNTFAVASQVDADFDTLYSWVNGSAIWADGSVAFTGVPSGPATDPTSANQFTRKTYVDNKLLSGSTPVSLVLGTANTTWVSGVATISFTPAFANALIAAFVVPTTSGGGGANLAISTDTYTTGSFKCHLDVASTGAAFSAPMTIAFIALGH